MNEKVQDQQSRIKRLIAIGREKGFLTPEEVRDHLPEDITDPEQIEEIFEMFNITGIQVRETAPEDEELLMALKCCEICVELSAEV